MGLEVSKWKQQNNERAQQAKIVWRSIIGITTKADQFARLRVTLSVMLVIITYFIEV
jgi:hypothetical protein